MTINKSKDENKKIINRYKDTQFNNRACVVAIYASRSSVVLSVKINALFGLYIDAKEI